MKRFTIETHGYRWKVHGSEVGGKWGCHLVELDGPFPLDRVVDKALLETLRTAIASFLEKDIEDVKRIPEDLILA